MIAYRIHIVDDKAYGKPECDINTTEKRRFSKRQVRIKRDGLIDGVLYVPEVDKIVDETDKYLINAEIDELTLMPSPDGGRILRSMLQDLTDEEAERYWDLESERSNFLSGELNLIDVDKINEYFDNIEEKIAKKKRAKYYLLHIKTDIGKFRPRNILMIFEPLEKFRHVCWGDDFEIEHGNLSFSLTIREDELNGFIDTLKDLEKRGWFRRLEVETKTIK